VTPEVRGEIEQSLSYLSEPTLKRLARQIAMDTCRHFDLVTHLMRRELTEARDGAETLAAESRHLGVVAERLGQQVVPLAESVIALEQRLCRIEEAIAALGAIGAGQRD
jgi:hypothetical protein